ncbi:MULTISPECIES: HAD-IIB family hydrolase [Bacillus cereus group]|uniref:HAD-IIB family hydrolase n=1 Tax=Bacillus cereus group TaxID=86661 RepID=UPI000BFB9D22|nr:MULTISPECIES: HAD-IIB family hydrolase [Bacillus cereus group]MDE7552919.1 Cof-type HAD-IIB family hydrolase [Bacillus tropicus]MDE7574118.1 Cof-type HAD-IIB family hydrolase [Bacillus tropicus]PHC82225.1 hydrolase [Bacillus wiedmannii]
MNFVFDLDGTLCFDGKSIDTEIIKVLQELKLEGHQVIFASARPIRDLVPVIPKSFHEGLLVGGNGTFTYDHGQIQVTHFEQQLLDKLIAVIHQHQLNYLADGQWDYAFTGDIAHPIYRNIDKTNSKNIPLEQLLPVCKLVLFQPDEEVLEMLEAFPVTVTHYKTEHAIDISPLGINKVKGLHVLNIQEFIAFGNDNNDQCLFENAVHSVCVGNNTVKRYAKENIERADVAGKIRALMGKYRVSEANTPKLVKY